MALPKKLKNFNLFGDGESWQGQIAELTLPELVRKTEEFRGAGMDGSVEIDQGLEAMSFEWTPAGLIDAVFDGFGGTTLDGSLLRFAGAYVRDDTDETVAVEVVVRGRHKQISMGTAKPGDDNTQTVTTSVSYYKLTIAGKDVIEIDVPGMIFIVNGDDRMAARRAAMGL